MLKIKNILFPTDFSECAEQAYHRATVLAKQHKATLHVLNVSTSRVTDPDNPMSYLDDIDSGESLEGRYDPQQHDQRAPVIYAQEWDVAETRGILTYAEKHDIDLIVMGTHGRRGLDRLLLGSVAEAIVRDAPCPVLVAQTQALQQHRPFKRIIVPLDFSSYAGPALAYAKHLAAMHDATLSLLFVAEEPVIPFFSDTGIPAFSRMQIDPEIIDRAGDALLQLAANTPGPEVPTTCEVRRGQPYREVIDCAEEHETDLIVMTTHGRSGIERGLLGSVTERVIRLAPCPVWTLNPRAISALKAQMELTAEPVHET